MSSKTLAMKLIAVLGTRSLCHGLDAEQHESASAAFAACGGYRFTLQRDVQTGGVQQFLRR